MVVLHVAEFSHGLVTWYCMLLRLIMVDVVELIKNEAMYVICSKCVQLKIHFCWKQSCSKIMCL